MSKTKIIKIEKSKAARCRFCHRFMGKNHNENHCVVDGWEDDKVKTVTDEDCEQCDFFKNKCIDILKDSIVSLVIRNEDI